jgi:N-acetylgalactosamine-N,N'-diacetylbacillosaminyl-diphospho-undecaprenol 4-alpha-N-acetylgalactosaminyltransferase
VNKTASNNILLIGFSFSMGGTQRMMTNLINEFGERKIPANVFIYNYSKGQPLEDQINADCVKIIRYQKGGGAKHLFRLIKLIKVIRKNKINRIFSFSLQGAYLSIFAEVLLFRKIKLIYRMVSVKNAVNHSEKKIKSKFNKFIFENLLLNAASTIVCQSNSMACDLLEMRNKKLVQKTRVIHNFFSIKNISEKSKIEIDVKDEFLLFVGRLSPEKNIEGIINAYSMIADKITEKLVIIGEGKLKEDLTLQIEKKGLGNKIIMIGNQSNIYKFIAKAKCLILFSTYEGMPNVILEAMACKTGVIVSNFDGYRDIVEDKVTGFVVENRNVPMLSEKIYQMINQNDHREEMQKKAFQFISEMNRNSQEKYLEILQ